MDNIITAYKNMFLNWKDFSGKSDRGAFWWAVLADLIISVVISTICSFLGTVGTIITTIYGLVVLVPSLALTVRRLHDVAKSGWFILIALIPLVGWIILLVKLAGESK